MTRPETILNEADLAWTETDRGGRNAWKRKRFGHVVGLAKLGASLYELEPGKRAYPLHWHTANEELLYVLSGSGKLRLGAGEISVGAGDVLAFPVGPEHAHELIATGDAPLRYLAVSTNAAPDVVHYPDSHKIMTIEGRDPDGKPLGGVYPEGAAVDYWQGEE